MQCNAHTIANCFPYAISRILKENVILEESEAETEMSSLAYDVTTSGPPTSGLVAASALPTSAPTLLRDFDPILDELKAESDSGVCIFNMYLDWMILVSICT